NSRVGPSSLKEGGLLNDVREVGAAVVAQAEQREHEHEQSERERGEGGVQGDRGDGPEGVGVKQQAARGRTLEQQLVLRITRGGRREVTGGARLGVGLA